MGFGKLETKLQPFHMADLVHACCKQAPRSSAAAFGFRLSLASLHSCARLEESSGSGQKLRSFRRSQHKASASRSSFSARASASRASVNPQARKHCHLARMQGAGQ